MNIFSRRKVRGFRDKWQWFTRDRRGSVAVETALLLPLGIFATIGAWEVYNYYRAAAVVDRTAFMIANSVAMQRELTQRHTLLANDVCTYAEIMPVLMTPLNYKASDSVEIQLYATQEVPPKSGRYEWINRRVWSSRDACNQPKNAASQVGAADFPSPTKDDTIVTVEVFYNYTPFSLSSHYWQQLGGEQRLYSRAFFRPRFGDLKVLK